eukprot:203668-Hanusia_phi.AAC.2
MQNKPISPHRDFTGPKKSGKELPKESKQDCMQGGPAWRVSTFLASRAVQAAAATGDLDCCKLNIVPPHELGEIGISLSDGTPHLQRGRAGKVAHTWPGIEYAPPS